LLQHRVLAYPPACLDLARFVVAAKVRSQLQAARHYQRHGQTAATVCGQRIQQVAQQLAAAQDLENLRGLEGQASAAWYELFAQLLAPPWHFPGRERRPPTDPVNALLSLGYMLLFRRLEGRCDALGLETGLGALHAFRPGRPSLVCDLIEPLRLPAVDRWVLQVCAGGQLTREHFVVTDKGVHLTEERLPSIIANWEAHYWQGGQERALDRWLREWIARLRQWVGRLPPLLQESSEEGGVGNSRSGL
jgi:CRISPR-associated protein Cas1